MHKKISIEQSKISDGINFVEKWSCRIKNCKKAKNEDHACGRGSAGQTD